MYRILRDIHLAIGLACFPVLLIYAITGFGMFHHRFVPTSETARSVDTVAVAPSTDAEGLATILRTRGARGTPGATRATGDSLLVRFGRPGLTHEARLTRGSGAAVVTVSREGVLVTLDRLHRASGLSARDAGTTLWGWLVLACSIGLIMLGLGGTWLWVYRLKERQLGAWFLATSLVVAGGLLVAIRWVG